MPLDEFPLQTCGFEWIEGFNDGDWYASCELPDGHLGDHKLTVVYTCSQVPLGPCYTPPRRDGDPTWQDLMRGAFDRLVEHQLNATPLARSLSTSGQTFGRPEPARSAVLFTTTSTPAQPGASSTSSASPATPTETQ